VIFQNCYKEKILFCYINEIAAIDEQVISKFGRNKKSKTNVKNDPIKISMFFVPAPNQYFVL